MGRGTCGQPGGGCYYDSEGPRAARASRGPAAGAPRPARSVPRAAALASNPVRRAARECVLQHHSPPLLHHPVKLNQGNSMGPGYDYHRRLKNIKNCLKDYSVVVSRR